MRSPPSCTTLYSLVDTVSIDTMSITSTIRVMMVPGEKRGVARGFAERLRGAFPDARLERRVAGSRAFVPEDKPERLAGLIGTFLRSGGG